MVISDFEHYKQFPIKHFLKLLVWFLTMYHFLLVPGHQLCIGAGNYRHETVCGEDDSIVSKV